jgi:hypothetical protein
MNGTPHFFGMPHAKILTKQALYILSQLHSELAGKLSANQRETKRLRLAIFQVEAVMKLLSPEVNLRLIAPERRNTRQSVVRARLSIIGAP